MNRKIWIGLLVLVALLGPISSFSVKPAQANTGDERRVMLCAAWPWHDEGWNKVTPPPSSDQDSTYSLTNSIQSKPQNLQQRPQRSFWSRLQFFLFNLKLLFEGK